MSTIFVNSFMDSFSEMIDNLEDVYEKRSLSSLSSYRIDDQDIYNYVWFRMEKDNLETRYNFIVDLKDNIVYKVRTNNNSRSVATFSLGRHGAILLSFLDNLTFEADAMKKIYGSKWTPPYTHMTLEHFKYCENWDPKKIVNNFSNPCICCKKAHYTCFCKEPNRQSSKCDRCKIAIYCKVEIDPSDEIEDDLAEKYSLYFD